MKKEIIIIFLCSCLLVTLKPVASWGSSNKDRVRLADVSSITLEAGRMTNGRRSSPVPQLKCVGGSAGPSATQPKIVQCYNRGSDGYDVQWECKADMDYDYRFGKLQVSCEGYDSPDDPYVLRGSCGLEYELDLTEQGRDNRHRGGGGGGGYYDNHHGNQGGSHHYQDRGGIGWGKIISLVILGTVAYWLFKSCCSGRGRRYTPTSTGEYYSSGTSPSSGGTAGTGGGGGFWTGAATGGLLGYMFGNRGGGYGGWGRNYGPSWGGGYTSGTHRSSGWSSGGGWGSSRPSSSRSSGSRTTSGFGGTSRR